jgi:hypothetical protein
MKLDCIDRTGMIEQPAIVYDQIPVASDSINAERRMVEIKVWVWITYAQVRERFELQSDRLHIIKPLVLIKNCEYR